jgi:formyltetrahydrofolate synthetase
MVYAFIISMLLSVNLAIVTQTGKLDSLHNQCRLVRGHAHMISQMIDENQFNGVVAKAHYDMIDKSLREMETTLSTIESELAAAQKNRVATELKTLNTICQETKGIVSNLNDELLADEVDKQRVRVLTVRIQRSLKTAMDTQESMKKKL